MARTTVLQEVASPTGPTGFIDSVLRSPLPAGEADPLPDLAEPAAGPQELHRENRKSQRDHEQRRTGQDDHRDPDEKHDRAGQQNDDSTRLAQADAAQILELVAERPRGSESPDSRGEKPPDRGRGAPGRRAENRATRGSPLPAPLSSSERRPRPRAAGPAAHRQVPRLFDPTSLSPGCIDGARKPGVLIVRSCPSDRSSRGCRRAPRTAGAGAARRPAPEAGRQQSPCHGLGRPGQAAVLGPRRVGRRSVELGSESGTRRFRTGDPSSGPKLVASPDLRL